MKKLSHCAFEITPKWIVCKPAAMMTVSNTEWYRFSILFLFYFIFVSFFFLLRLFIYFLFVLCVTYNELRQRFRLCARIDWNDLGWSEWNALLIRYLYVASSSSFLFCLHKHLRHYHWNKSHTIICNHIIHW